MSSIHPYEIKEIYSGQYHMMLDFPDVRDILKIISTDLYKKVLDNLSNTICYRY